MSKNLMHNLMSGLLSGLALCTSVTVHAATTRACRLPDFPQEVQCGQIQRPLNPAQPQGKQIDIHYVVVPSQDRNKLPDAVFLLAGGPGQSAIKVASWGTSLLSRLNRRRDLVFVDQRGTGRSAPLECPALEKADEVLSPEQKTRLTDECLQQLQKLTYGELQYFSTSIAVQDLEAVRQQQGYGRINLVGASYGTRAGLEYLRQYPQSVRRIVLDGVVPPSMRLAISDAQKALDALFKDCVKEPACNASYPDLANRWKKLLASQPQKVSMLHPRLGTPLKFEMTHDGLIGLVHGTLYNPTGLSTLPYALTQAEQGNYAPLVTMSGATNLPGPGGVSYGMHFSVWCGEAFAQSPTLPANDEFEKLMVQMYTQTCKKWPRADIPAGFFEVPASASPALLLSGGVDPVTPTRYGEQVAKALGPQARHVQIENAGHGLLAQGCVRDVVHRFLNAKQDDEAVKIDASCVRQIPRALAWQAPVPAKKTGTPDKVADVPASDKNKEVKP
ncbi:alpha/beta hydrolase [Undibacterium sp. TS12]|uniref:alpha/beta hydrolase n=1 Tax=Undibacterium sp. TS12 TaxID=2908202 RepID=UPI001F4CFCA1|nr:alpha/beta hydrolase [Undibacterium sp. TS12]MCH8619479.1 alpha/beta hydrolase [Undibacterium sp. TS12]